MVEADYRNLSEVLFHQNLPAWFNDSHSFNPSLMDYPTVRYSSFQPTLRDRILEDDSSILDGSEGDR